MTVHGTDGTPLSLAATILAGGSGTRFWPVSTPRRPKQFLTLIGKRTMLQHTFDRLQGLVPPERTLVITNQRYVDLVKEQLPTLPQENIIGEPVARDTAAAVALGTIVAHRRWDEPVMLTAPADHAIEPVDVFQVAVTSAARAAASSGALYTFGVAPTRPAVEYGYLEAGTSLDEDGTSSWEHFQVKRFQEKPDRPTAERYAAQPDFYWNSGMFVWKTGAFWQELAKHLPQHAHRLEAAGAFDGDPRWAHRLKEALDPLPKVSVDVGVMEKAGDVRMVKAPFRWSDVGGWTALADYLERDHNGNRATAGLHGLDAVNNIVYCASEDETVALIGVQDLVVVRAGRRTLVVHRDKLDDVKKLVASMDIA